uniref:AB hydrolase-1 domain-containing protein n=1 Tax=Anopheles culicifacies TaxID=139723 RepID=A0A182M175_9DIPT
MENINRNVLAGDTIEEPMELMKTNKKVVLGPGLRIEKDVVRASKCGQLKMKPPNTFWIDAYQRRYVPNRGELVIGVVIAKAGDIFRLDIGSCETASLSYMAFEGATKKNRPDVNVGDIVYARLLIAHPDVEPELVCVDSHGKKGKLGVLHEGFMLCCSLNLIRKILNPKCAFLALLAKELPFEMAAGKWWGSRMQQPVLALHGWQDNAGTFDRLCPLLPSDIPILAIDLPGHGKSSHYPKGMHYFIFWDGITLIRRIVKYYGWTKITLLGHSLGGALSFMYAASFPDEVDRFISIDIAGPTVRDHHKTAASTGDCIDKFLHYETLPESKMPCYGYEEMIDLVLAAYDGSVDYDSVEVLMRRGMALAPAHFNKEGYHFARDLRLKVALLGMFSMEQVLAYAERIKCKVLNIRADPGMKFDNPAVYTNVMEVLKRTASKVVYYEIPGSHHLHLVTPDRVSKQISEFLLE